MKTMVHSCVLLFFLHTHSPVKAESFNVTLDPDQTKITFTLGATLHTVHGVATVKSGRLQFDSKTGKANGDVLIEAQSLTTKNKGRDEKMHEKVLETKKYPFIIFNPQKVVGELKPEGENVLSIHGTMEIHGATQELDFSTTAQISNRKFKAKTDFWIPYVEWGMKDPSVFLLKVEKKVHVMIEASGELNSIK